MISEADLAGLMALCGLRIEDERLPAVLENLRRMAQVYQAVAAVELGPEDEIGPEWRP